MEKLLETKAAYIHAKCHSWLPTKQMSVHWWQRCLQKYTGKYENKYV